jgi:hypothetical protein
MRESSLQREIDEWFQQSQSLREQGRYAESMRALLTAAELINRYADDRPHQPAAEAAAIG